MPESQGEQSGWPKRLNFPAWHGEHVAARPVEKVPGLQGVQLVACEAAYFPESQGEQSGWPEGLNFPAGHGEHATVRFAE